MALAGRYNKLRVIKQVDFGVYLDGGEAGEILLPKRYVPADIKEEDDIDVFVYHDNENRLIATTLRPKGIVGDIVMLEVVSTTAHGAFAGMGIMKDLFIPISQQESKMRAGQSYLINIYIDELTGRMTGTEKISKLLSNHDLTVNERDIVDLVVFQKTDIGYKVIINNKHLGVLHYNDVFSELEIGDKVKGFIKNIRPDNKIDVGFGEPGYKKVEGEEDKIIRLLEENSGYLPYHDKSDPEEIYSFFGMSKKTFKMTTGALYKKRKIAFTQSGIQLVSED